MKTYIDAELQVVRVKNSNVILTSVPLTSTGFDDEGKVGGADRIRDDF